MTRIAAAVLAAFPAVLLAAGAAPGAAQETIAAQETPAAAPLFGWSATYASRYSFQGFDYSNGRPVVQPEVSAEMRGVALLVWGNLDQDRGEVNEIDVTVRVSGTRGRLAASAGYVALRYPNRIDWEPSQELALDLQLDAPGQPAISAHWDFDEGSGVYGSLGVGHELDASVALSARLYAQQGYYGASGISAAELRAGTSWTWAGLTWEPSIARLWSWPNGDLTGEEAASPGWLLGITLSPR